MREREDKPAEETETEYPEPTLGERLRSARESSPLSMREIAEEMRVEQRVLESLEADHFDGLGAPVFVKGYIKQYGRQLGLQYEDLLGAYYRQVGAQEVVIQPTRSIQLRDERQITAWIVAALVLLLLVVVLFVWWLGGEGAPFVSAGRVGAPPVMLEQRPSAETSRPAAAAAETAGAAPAFAPPASTGRAAPNAAPVAATPAGAAADGDAVADGAPEPSEAAAPREAVAAAATSAPQSQQAAIDEGLLPVSIEFVEDSWAEVNDARGEQLFYDLGAAGTAVTLYGEPPVRVFLGNADGVRITVDGGAYSIPSRSRRGNLANLVINPITD